MPLGTPGLESLMKMIPPLPGGGDRSAPSPSALASSSSPVGAAPPGSPAPGGGGGGMIGDIINKMQSQGAGTDPDLFIDQITQMKHIVSGMLPKALMRYPGQVDKQLQNLLRAIDSTMKAFQDAQQHQQALAGPGVPKTIDFAGATAAPGAAAPATV